MATKKAAKKPAKKAAKKGAKKAAKKGAKKAAKKKQFGHTGNNYNFPQAHATLGPRRPFEGTDNAL